MLFRIHPIQLGEREFTACMGVVLFRRTLELPQESTKEKRLMSEPFFFDRQYAAKYFFATVSVILESL